MTMDVNAIDSAARALDLEVVSPELALVDPELGRAARALLADPAELAARARLLTAVSFADGSSLDWSAESVAAARERPSRRLLVGVAAATMLALLLFDVRVEVGQRPAAAESEAVGKPTRTVTTNSIRTPPPVARKRRLNVGPAPTGSERKFAWAPFSGASGYHVEFFRGSVRVFATETKGPSLTVPAQWTFGGRSQSFLAGEYGWYVWPIVDGRRQSRAVVQTTVSISGR